MCYPVDGDSWMTLSPTQNLNEERLEDYEELVLVTGLAACPGKVEQVVSFSDPSLADINGGSDCLWSTGISRAAKRTWAWTDILSDASTLGAALEVPEEGVGFRVR